MEGLLLTGLCIVLVAFLGERDLTGVRTQNMRLRPWPDYSPVEPSCSGLLALTVLSIVVQYRSFQGMLTNRSLGYSGDAAGGSL